MEKKEDRAGFTPWQLRERSGVAFLEYPEWSGARCLFSTRIGGTSSVPYDTLNLSYKVGDDGRCVDANIKAFRESADVGDGKIVRTRQIHSSIVNLVDSTSAEFTGDGLATRLRGQWLAVSLADCLPVLLWDGENQAVGIVHAGWRGTLQGVSARCLEKMSEWFGSEPSRIRALVGPGIGACCFEVSQAIARQFERLFPASSDGTHVDLFEANRQALRHAGIGRVDGEPICTSCDEARFFSHRRDGGTTGRMLAMISME